MSDISIIKKYQEKIERDVFTKHLFESLGVNLDAFELSLKIIAEIKSDINNVNYDIKHIRTGGDIYSNVLKIPLFDSFDKNLLVYYNVFYFKNRNEFQLFDNKSLLYDSFSDPLKFEIHISFPCIKNEGIRSSDFENAVHHEVQYVFEEYKKGGYILSDEMQNAYNRCFKYLISKKSTEKEKLVVKLGYYSFPVEITANLNGLEGEIIKSLTEYGVLFNISKTETYNIVFDILEMIDNVYEYRNEINDILGWSYPKYCRFLKEAYKRYVVGFRRLCKLNKISDLAQEMLCYFDGSEFRDRYGKRKK